jgi:hypothetical protein
MSVYVGIDVHRKRSQVAVAGDLTLLMIMDFQRLRRADVRFHR